MLYISVGILTLYEPLQSAEYNQNRSGGKEFPLAVSIREWSACQRVVSSMATSLG